MESKKLAYNLMIIALILTALYVGKNLLIPFVIALVVWYLLSSLRKLVAKIRFGKKESPWYVQLIVAASFLMTISFFLVRLVASNFEQFVAHYPTYHDNILEYSGYVTENFDLPLSMNEMIDKLGLPNLMTDLLNSSFNLFSTFLLVLIYVVFIILEERVFSKKIQAMFSTKEKYDAFRGTISQIDEKISVYLSAKTALCFLTALASYVILIVFDVDFAILWSFLIFLLTFIPFIGAFVGIVFPTLIALIQFDGYVDAVLVFTLLTAVMLIIGNFVEPKVLGDRLNLSPLSVIVALSFWGALWGVAGMFLCVPITVILMIIFAQFPTTRPVAVLLSGGKID